MLIPATETSPAPTPTLLVAIVEDGHIDLATWVAIAAALISAFAAFATWRAAVAARDATKSGEAAAIAAQQTAALERASFQAATEEREKRQASAVTVEAEGYAHNGYDAYVTVSFHNGSDRPIYDIEVSAILAGHHDSTGIGKSSILSEHQRNQINVPITGADAPIAAEAHENRGLIRFTDADGARWQRRSREVPTRIDR